MPLPRPSVNPAEAVAEYHRLLLGEVQDESERLRRVIAPAPATPGVLARGAHAVGSFIANAPLVKPIQEAARGLVSGEPETVEQRPLTRALMDAAFAGAAQEATGGLYLPGRGRLVPGAGGNVDPVTVGRVMGDAVSSTTLGRASAEFARDAAEMVGFFKIGGAVAGKAADFLGMATGGSKVASAIGASSVGEAEVLAAQAAKAAGRRALFERIGTDLTVGELFGVADAVEHQQLDPLRQFIVNPLAIAGLGIALFGGAAAVRRFGPANTERATALLGTDAGVQATARDALGVRDAVKRAGQLSTEDASDLVFRAVRGQLNNSDVMLMQEVLTRNPRLVKSDLGLHLVRQLRAVPEGGPQLVTSTERFRITYEDAATRREITESPRGIDDIRELARKSEQRLIYVKRVEGRPDELALFDKSRGAPVATASGTEVGAQGGPAPVATPQDAEALRRGTSPLDAVERETLAGPAGVYEAGLSSTVTQMREVSKGVFEAETQRLRGEQKALGPGAIPLTERAEQLRDPEYLRAPLALNRESAPPPLPRIDDRVQIRGTSRSGVVVGDHPQGVLLRLDTGEKIIATRNHLGEILPPTILDVPAPKIVPPNAGATAKAITEKPMTLRAGGDPVTSHVDPETGAVTLANRATGESVVVGTETAARLASEGRVVASPAAVADVPALVARIEGLNKTVVAYRPGLDPAPMHAAMRERTEALRELLDRMGTTMLSENLPGILRVLREAKKIAGEERGSISLTPAPVRQPALPETDVIGAQARSLGGAAREAADGRVTVEFNVGGQRLPVTYASRAEAFAGLRALAQRRLEEGQLTTIVERAGRTGKLPPIGGGSDVDVMLGVLRLRDVAGADPARLRAILEAPLDSVERYATGWASPAIDALIPAVSKLARLGPAGKELANRILLMQETYNRLRGESYALIDTVFKPLTESEIATGLRAMAEKGAGARLEVRAAWETLNEHGERMLASARALGIDDVAPFRERYFPWIYDITQLRDPKATQALVSRLVESGVARNVEDALAQLAAKGLGGGRAKLVQSMVAKSKAAAEESVAAGRTAHPILTQTEAEAIVDRFIVRKADRISGHLERERIGTGEGTIDDARRAYTIAFSRNARRLAEVAAFGQRDQIVYSLIDRIAAEAGDVGAAANARKFATRLHDLVIGRERTVLEGALRDLHSWQSAKLSLSVLANLTQIGNTIMRTSLRDTAGALFDVMRSGPGKAARHAREVGEDVFSLLSEANEAGVRELDRSWVTGPLRQIKGSIENISTKAFNLVEVYANRGVAQQAGERYFMRTLESLRANPRDTLARARMRELRFDADGLLGRGDADITEAMYLAGQRISGQTQFRVNAATMPLWWNHPLGRFVYQFKSFAVAQTKAVVDGLTAGRRGDWPRTFRTLAVLSTLYPAMSLATVKLREALLGETMSSKAINEMLDDPASAQAIMGYAALLASTGSLGILADMTVTTMLGNRFAASSFFIPPAAGSILNGLDIGWSVFAGTANADPAEYEKAVRTFGRETGGIGAAFVYQLMGDPKRGGRATTGGFSGFSGFRGFGR